MTSRLRLTGLMSERRLHLYDLTIFHEYAVDRAIACHARGIKSIAVSAGYVRPEPRAEFYRHMDAANIDLKGFTEEFYHKICYARLRPVLDTLVYVKRETRGWLRSRPAHSRPQRLRCGAGADDAMGGGESRPGRAVALHGFHPDWRMRDIPPTPSEALSRARAIAMKNGVRYAFTGNVHDPSWQATYCHNRQAPPDRTRLVRDHGVAPHCRRENATHAAPLALAYLRRRRADGARNACQSP